MQKIKHWDFEGLVGQVKRGCHGILAFGMQMLLNVWDFSLDRVMALMGEGEPGQVSESQMISQKTSQTAFETFPF